MSFKLIRGSCNSGYKRDYYVNKKTEYIIKYNFDFKNVCKIIILINNKNTKKKYYICKNDDYIKFVPTSEKINICILFQNFGNNKEIIVKEFDLFKHQIKINWISEKILNNSIKLKNINYCLKKQNVEFNYGIASGDPTSNSIILWTHAKYTNLNFPITLFYELSDDVEFKNIIKYGNISSNINQDFTFKIKINCLKENKTYYYRFGSTNNKNNIQYSNIGRTNTIPNKNNNISNIKLAVVSCANYPQGYFNVYKEICKEKDISCVIHLGDYIYEYSNTDSFGIPINKERESKPSHETITLNDYRCRHSQYKQDPDLQKLHSMYPIIAVWDDHEVVDDAWKDGAPSMPNKCEFLKRKHNGLKAYCEWMPITVDKSKCNMKIYRSFDFGNLLSLHMIDSRFFGREKQINPVDFIIPETREETNNKLNNENRELLGKSQFNWLKCKIKSSESKWQILGSQVLMSKIKLPISILQHSSPLNPELINKAIIEYLVAKQTPPEFRTPEQKILMDTSLFANPLLGYNLDAWDGYPSQREQIFNFIKEQNINFATISGDSHNGWFNKLVNNNNDTIGYEFGAPSVTSYGLEYFLNPLSPAEIKSVFETIPENTEWMQPQNRGYLLLSIFDDKIDGDYKFVTTTESTNYNTFNETKTYTL
jgi:alkaline phosphatase D